MWGAEMNVRDSAEAWQPALAIIILILQGMGGQLRSEEKQTKLPTVVTGYAVAGTSFTLTTPLKSGDNYEWLLVAADNHDDASASVSDTFSVS
jgi:hypothetical protein